MTVAFLETMVPSALDIDRNEHFARLIAITLQGRAAGEDKAVLSWAARRRGRPRPAVAIG